MGRNRYTAELIANTLNDTEILHFFGALQRHRRPTKTLTNSVLTVLTFICASLKATGRLTPILRLLLTDVFSYNEATGLFTPDELAMTEQEYMLVVHRAVTKDTVMIFLTNGYITDGIPFFFTPHEFVEVFEKQTTLRTTLLIKLASKAPDFFYNGHNVWLEKSIDLLEEKKLTGNFLAELRAVFCVEVNGLF